MEKLLKSFLKESGSRGIIFSKKDLEEIKDLSKKTPKNFHRKLLELYSKYYENLVIPEDTYSFYIHQNIDKTLIVTFYNILGDRIDDLIFKNINFEDLEIFLFKQLVGGWLKCPNLKK